jgi:hypothetical protein
MFRLEVPLPPQGRVEVLISLPESQVLLSRPPKYQLPMVDFSFRPLFAFLSIDNILAVFSCLCQEMSVCVCSKNIALLTPVQEALLSLLFPFVWQGCYVPVLPIDMLELLHAPVPLLTGLQCDDVSFLVDDPTSRPQNVVILHIDSDTVHYGSECNPLPLPRLLVQKLRQKILEHGSAPLYSVHEEVVVLQEADLMYPNDEHLVPMTRFISSQGVLTNLNVSKNTSTAQQLAFAGSKRTTSTNGGSDGFDDGASDAGSILSSATSTTVKGGFSSLRGFYSGSVPSKPSKEQKYQHVSAADHPAVCCRDANLIAVNAAKGNTHSSSRRFPLDPAFNIYTDSINVHGTNAPTILSTFNAMEVRGAFLRFFVAAFQKYEEYFNDFGEKPVPERSASTIKKNGPFLASKGGAQSVDSGSFKHSSSLHAAVQQQKLSHATAPTGLFGSVSIKKNFDKDRYLADQDDPFLKHM